MYIKMIVGITETRSKLMLAVAIKYFSAFVSLSAAKKSAVKDIEGRLKTNAAVMMVPMVYHMEYLVVLTDLQSTKYLSAVIAMVVKMDPLSAV